MIEHWQKVGFGLYVHWPYCQSKCPYCDFNSHVAGSVDQDVWADAYLSELKRLRDETGARPLASIFFGGGTPSLMNPRLVEQVISAAVALWPASNDIEITLEANPTSVETQKMRDFRFAGVNRVSIGVQALNDSDLRRLGRMHDAGQARAAIRAAQDTFDRFSFDLIYARQDQSAIAWEKELKEALAIGSRHLSLYQLTIENGTVFGERFAKGQLRGLPDEELGAELYELTQDLCEAEGMPAYEVSNHAVPGQESRHNLIYWRSGDFAGVGPGAHGRLTLSGGRRVATECHRAPQVWLRAVESGPSGESGREHLSAAERAEEFLVMGLRTSEGVCLDEMTEATQHEVHPKSLKEMINMGFLTLSNRRVQATRTGRLLLNSLLAQLEIVQVA